MLAWVAKRSRAKAIFLGADASWDVGFRNRSYRAVGLFDKDSVIVDLSTTVRTSVGNAMLSRASRLIPRMDFAFERGAAKFTGKVNGSPEKGWNSHCNLVTPSCLALSHPCNSLARRCMGNSRVSLSRTG